MVAVKRVLRKNLTGGRICFHFLALLLNFYRVKMVFLVLGTCSKSLVDVSGKSINFHQRRNVLYGVISSIS